MNRRLFTSSMAAGMLGAISPCGAQQGAFQRRGLRLSVTCDMFRGEEVRLPFDTPDRRDPRPKPRRKLAPRQALALVQASGYQAFELFDWRDPVEWDGYRKAQQTYGLYCACIEANKGVRAPGCGLTDPSERKSFLRELKAAIDAGKEIGTKLLVVLTGLETEGMSRKEQMDSCVAGLRAAAALLEANGMTIIVEPINTLVTRPGYFLCSTREAFEMLRRVDSPYVKLLFDIYHVQIMDGDLISQIRNNVDLIGHFHIGDHPGRHQPGTGEINYRNVLRAIYELQEDGKYSGCAALEYHPTVPLEQTMREVRRLADFG